MTDALFDLTPTARRVRTVGELPGDTVQDSLFGDVPVVVARKHPRKTVEAAVDRTDVLFATDERQFAGQAVTADIFGGACHE